MINATPIEIRNKYIGYKLHRFLKVSKFLRVH